MRGCVDVCVFHVRAHACDRVRLFMFILKLVYMPASAIV